VVINHTDWFLTILMVKTLVLKRLTHPCSPHCPRTTPTLLLFLSVGNNVGGTEACLVLVIDEAKHIAVVDEISLS